MPEYWSTSRPSSGAPGHERIRFLMQGMSLVLSAHHLGLMVIGVLLRHPGRRAAGPRCAERVGAAAAADLQHVAGVGDHPAFLHVLGRVVRRLDHLDPVQHPRRAVVGGHHLRRLPDGAQRPGWRSADRRLHLGAPRGAGRRAAADLPVHPYRSLRPGVQLARVLRRLPAGVLHLHRHEPQPAIEDPGGDDHRLRHGRRGHGYRVRRAAL